MDTLHNKKVEIIESLRGFAAIYVVIHHFLGFTDLKDITPSFIHFPFRFGQEIVMLFFLMSGFVIYTANKNIETKTFNTYIKKRFTRIYPIFLLTLVLSIIILILNNEFFKTSDLKDLIGNLAMLQDTGNKPGAIVYPFLKNYPLWSLSYEWWFYLIFFPLSVFIHKSSTFKRIPSIYLILSISAVSYLLYLFLPNHLLLILSHLIIWWAGVYIAKIYFGKEKLSIKTLKPIYFSLIVMTLLSCIPIGHHLMRSESVLDVNDFPIIDLRHYLSALLIITIGHMLFSINFKHIEQWFKPFAKLAPISYAMYCVHFPIILLKMPLIQNPMFLLVIKLGLVIIISYVFDVVLQPYFNKISIGNKISKLEMVK